MTGRQVGEGERDPAADSGVDVASSGPVPGNFSKCTERPATTSNGDFCRKQYNLGSHSPRAKRNFKAQRAGVPVSAKRMNALARCAPRVPWDTRGQKEPQRCSSWRTTSAEREASAQVCVAPALSAPTSTEGGVGGRSSGCRLHNYLKLDVATSNITQ